MRSAPGLFIAPRHPFSRIPRWAWIAFIAAVTASSAWYLTSNYRKALAQRVADAKAWAIEGPPCPRITAAQFLWVHRQPPRRFEFEGVVFFRRYGHVECAAIRDRGGRGDRRHAVCQFTSPGDLLIRTPAGEWSFRPGPGQPATVSTARSPPNCVMNSNFRLNPR
ncbi:hypothetical protein [uncultured Phenylobacterium sp.]|uniref:hypothetical protein n=1 Tax=uncultured Phenylobacterium sp. TaxID=349273 RepID=UPI0026015BC0|nr:hypothetical protein [uncultured Phenylobacterium sp.]